MSAPVSTTVNIVAEVKKYMSQLKNENKIGHALRCLNRIDMTVEVLKEILVGKEVRRLLGNHPEHGQFARALVKKWMALFLDETAPAGFRKRPAENTITDHSGDELTAKSGLSFKNALKTCAAPPPAKKLKLAVPKAPVASVLTPANPPTKPVKPDSDDLFEIRRKHTQSRMYSGKQTALDVANENAPALPTIANLMRGPSKFDYRVVSPVLCRCTAAQLEEVERHNPEWRKHTDSLWRRLCLQKFPKAVCIPQDHKSWRSSYQRHIKEADQQLADLAAKINKDHSREQKTKTALVPLPKASTRLRTQASLNGLDLPFRAYRRSSSPDKPAPMMAKTIKMMKNRYRR